MTVPGIGPIISSAVVAAIGKGTGFRQGRDFAAWLGLIPRPESTGHRTILGKISKRGNKYLGTLFVQAAHVVPQRPEPRRRALLVGARQTRVARDIRRQDRCEFALNALRCHARSPTRQISIISSLAFWWN